MVNKKIDETTEERILSAAQKVFVNKGMAGARMQDIADEAGINKALLHYYFRNKDILFETIFKKLSQQFFPQLNIIFDCEEPLFKKIEMFCSAYIDKIVANPYIPLFILNEMNQRPESFVAMLKNNWPKPIKLLNQIDGEVKTGKIRNITPVQLLMNMISLCVFPFIGKPMFMMVMNMDESAFSKLIQQRKKDVPLFIIESIKI